MGEKIKQDYRKHILIYLSALIVVIALYPFDFLVDFRKIIVIYWLILGCQLLFLKKKIKRDLLLIIGVSIIGPILHFLFPIYLRIDILVAILLVVLICYYLLISTSKYKWLKILAVASIIPLLLSIKGYTRKDKLIKDIKLEKEIKEMIETNEDIEEELTINNLQNLSSVWIWDSICNLQGIEYLRNLEELYVLADYIDNIEKIGMLNNLKKLSISEHILYRIGRIKGLESLEYLKLSFFRIYKDTSINNFSGLKELSIYGARFKDLSFTNQLKKLEKLSLRGCKIQSLDGIESLSNLKKIELNHTKIKNIDKIKESKSLEELELWESEIGDVDKLQKETDFKITVREETYLDKILYE